MQTSARIFSGGCLCGGVRYSILGTPDRVLNCHCNSCRHHTGAPMATLAVFQADQVTFSGTSRKAFQSAPDVERAFCPECGTSMTWESDFRDEGRLCAVHISTFDEPEALPPDGHSFYPERIGWFDVADTLPRHAAFVSGSTPVQFGPRRKEG